MIRLEHVMIVHDPIQYDRVEYYNEHDHVLYFHFENNHDQVV